MPRQGTVTWQQAVDLVGLDALRAYVREKTSSGSNLGNWQRRNAVPANVVLTLQRAAEGPPPDQHSPWMNERWRQDCALSAAVLALCDLAEQDWQAVHRAAGLLTKLAGWDDQDWWALYVGDRTANASLLVKLRELERAGQRQHYLQPEGTSGLAKMAREVRSLIRAATERGLDLSSVTEQASDLLKAARADLTKEKPRDGGRAV